MSQVLVTESYLEDIADAIREKNGTETTYKPPQMAAAIEALPDTSVLDSKSITANGTYDPSDDDLDGYDEVTVNVPNSYAAGDEGKVVSNGALVAQTARSSDITENGTYDTTLNDEVTVAVSGGGGGDIGAVVSPAFQGLTYVYCLINGTQINTGPNKTNYVQIYEVKANHKYALFVGDVIGTRRRAGFFSGLSISDINPYLNTQPSSQTSLFQNGVWLAPFTQGTDDTGNSLAGRIIYTPSSNGIIFFGTDSSGNTCPAYCVDLMPTTT